MIIRLPNIVIILTNDRCPHAHLESGHAAQIFVHVPNYIIIPILGGDHLFRPVAGEKPRVKVYTPSLIKNSTKVYAHPNMSTSSGAGAGDAGGMYPSKGPTFDLLHRPK